MRAFIYKNISTIIKICAWLMIIGGVFTIYSLVTYNSYGDVDYSNWIVLVLSVALFGIPFLSIVSGVFIVIGVRLGIHLAIFLQSLQVFRVVANGFTLKYTNLGGVFISLEQGVGGNDSKYSISADYGSEMLFQLGYYHDTSLFAVDILAILFMFLLCEYLQLTNKIAA